MTVSIIVHAYGPFYITLLAEQLRSLACADAYITVCYHVDEGHLLSEALGEDFNGDPDIFWNALDRPQLLNRTIGRNMAAKESTADWVWFADADYLFGPGSLESLAKLDPHAACMYFPQTVHKTAYFYDDEPVFDAARTTPEKQRRAIGGCQIIPGHIARQWGYLDGVEKYHRPAVGDKFLDTRGDQAYRRWLAKQTGLPIVAADIPNVYRLRHRIPKSSRRHKLLPMGTTDGTITTPENANANLPD